MALQFEYRAVPGGTFTPIDLTNDRVRELRYAVSWEHPTRLTWSIHAGAHTVPIPHRAFVRLWDDAAINPLTNELFDEDAPLFEGYIEDVKPGPDGLTVNYVALDPSMRASNEMRVMSLPWQAPVGGAPPQRGVGATTRIVFNADSILNDDDAAYSRANNQTVGQIIQTLLDDQTEPLRWLNAAPDAPDVPYVVLGELAGLDFIPPEKVVFQEETLRSAIMRLLQYEPQWRMIWYPGERRWRFGDITTSPAVDLTLNDFTPANPYHVLSLNLGRSLEGRYTSVRFYGPPRIVNTIASTLHGEEGVTSDSGLFGPSSYVAWDGSTRYKYQITDPTMRSIASVLEAPIQTPNARGTKTNSTGSFTWYIGTIETWYPVLQARFPEGASGDGGWHTIGGWFVDKLTGEIDVGRLQITRPIHPEPNSPPLEEEPTEVRLIYGRYATPIEARYPTTEGVYEGTAYTDYGVESELAIYDEMLVVGWIYNIQFTTLDRIARFQELARRVHTRHKDTIYTGGVSLEGAVYDFAFLDRRVNLPAVDGDGNTLVTGWEDINAIVTDVEIDFSEGLTTVQFSSDQLSLFGMDLEQNKKELKIRAADPVWTVDVRVTFGTKRVQTPFRVGGLLVQTQHWDVFTRLDFVDEEGEIVT